MAHKGTRRKRESERVGGGIGRDGSLLVVHHTREVSMVSVCAYVCTCMRERERERVPRARGVRTEWKGSLACLLAYLTKINRA